MWRLLLVLCATVWAASAPAAAPPIRPSMADSFRLGMGGDTLCRVQANATDAAAQRLFDRAYAIVCRDAAAPVGNLYALERKTGDDPASRLDARRDPDLKCDDGGSVVLQDAGEVAVRRCRSADGLGYDVLRTAKGHMLYVAEGLAGYRSALELGLRTIVADRIVSGPITISTTDVGDAASFARAQAGSLDPALALDEGLRRNNSGSYAEASEFFTMLLQRRASSGDAKSSGQYGIYLVNRALQQSNLGNFDEADALFTQLDRLTTSDPVELRLRRNYRAIHLLNQYRLDAAMKALAVPVNPAASATLAGNDIDIDTSIALNAGSPLAYQLGISQAARLTPIERATLLDAQADALRGKILRLQRKPDAAATALAQALVVLDQIRGGRIASAARIRAQVMTEQSALAEGRGDIAAALTLLNEAVAVTAAEYPASTALAGAQLRLAGFLARNGHKDEALALYRMTVAQLSASGGITSDFAGLLDPYLELLVAGIRERPALADDLFIASEVLLRPGVADTQATLARELSAGDGEAARVFRQAINETRQAEKLRVELGQLSAIDTPTAEQRAAIAAARGELAQIEAEQSQTQAKLSGYPAYRAIATQALTLGELRAVLHPGEAYWKLSVVGPSIYGLCITPGSVRAWKVPITAAELARQVDRIRATIAVAAGGRTTTFPFDAADARKLYVDLAGPAADDLTRARHLIFEPDGAMLRLPAALLIDDQAGVDRYLARVRQPGADPYDMTGIDWLGAHIGISTALSARSFRDVRATPASHAAKTYIGFGQNAPVTPFLQLTSFTPPTTAIDCRWLLASWNHPISAAELVEARQVIGAGKADIVTEAKFTDTALTARTDLAGYRILHFATHGIVTAPRPECPAQPALLTSFGDRGSDGLLSFVEIYGLHLDADLIILSACDTAGTADVAVTRAAGVETGGGNALDGLVRAFIGAGSRSVLASHWPAPDDYHATEHLIEGLFTASPGTPSAEALRLAERRLMAVPATSHPYYWAGFALVGDGAKPILRNP